MKILLLTDIPPCSNYSGGLALARLCRLLPHDSVVLFVVLNRALDPAVPDDLSALEMTTVEKPREHGVPLRSLFGLRLPWLEWLDKQAWLKICRQQAAHAVDLGRRHGVDRVLAVLEGQTVVTEAVMVARNLSVPLHSLVWDPLDWWLTSHCVNPMVARHSRASFDRAIRMSQTCGAASEAMARHFEGRYATRSVPIFGGFPLPAPVDAGIPSEGPLRIGVAGQFYAADAWEELLRSLRRRNWTLAGRAVEIRVFGAAPPPGATDTDPIEFQGWHSETDLSKSLREVDILYCPYPFDPDLAEVARFSFPSKLSLYLGVGRPILFHGPVYSSPFEYLETRGAAICCPERDGDAALSLMERVLDQPDGVAGLIERARAAFMADHTEEALKRRLCDLLEVTPSELRSGRGKSKLYRTVNRTAPTGG